MLQASRHIDMSLIDGEAKTKYELLFLSETVRWFLGWSRKTFQIHVSFTGKFYFLRKS